VAPHKWDVGATSATTRSKLEWGSKTAKKSSVLYLN